MDGRVPLLAYKLPGTQGCLSGFEVLFPRSRGVSYHSQNGQYGSCVPHKPSGRFMVVHLGQVGQPILNNFHVLGKPFILGSNYSSKFTHVLLI